MTAEHRQFIESRYKEIAPASRAVTSGEATLQQRIDVMELELWNCIYSLPPDAKDSESDGWHASACALRAVVMLGQLHKQLQKLDLMIAGTEATNAQQKTDRI